MNGVLKKNCWLGIIMISEIRTKVEPDLICALEEGQNHSQTKLAKKFWIAVGLVNILIKRAIEHGSIKMKQIPRRRYVCHLTPKGFTEKAKLVGRYIHSSLRLYPKLRVEYQNIFNNLKAKDIQELMLVGDVDITELAITASFNTNIGIIGLVNSEINKSHIGSTPVNKDIYEEFKDTAVICFARTPQACFENLAEQLDPQQVFYPNAFYIRDDIALNVQGLT